MYVIHLFTLGIVHHVRATGAWQTYMYLKDLYCYHLSRHFLCVKQNMWVQHKNQKSIDEINVTAALSTAINHTSNYVSAEEKFNMSIENVPIL